VDEGIHDDYGISTVMMTVDPKSVRIEERAARGKASINGVSLLPVEKAVSFGRRAVDFRAERTAEAIRRAIGR
jgi:creatinine amidohydrolase